MPIERKLAAIMFTDIAGYTALSAKDENKALTLLDTQKKILNPIIDEFNGTLHKEVGDGLLFTFPTVTDAVKCGMKIQEETKAVEDLNLRIGIHEGEITLKDGDVLGDDINVASRIEPFSAIGGIAISSKVQQNISSLPEFETSYVGKPELKGVAQKVGVYCITSHGLPKVEEIAEPVIIESKSNFNIFALTGGILTAIGIAFWIAVGVFDVSFGGKTEVPSVGILMMENIGGEDDEFWVRGITEDLIVKIAGAGLIRVTSMKEVLEIDIKQSFEEIAKKMRVKYLLTSSLHKKTEGFDLRSQLIEVESGNSVYANKWSESLDNAPMIVGKLASDLLRTLKVPTKQEIAKAQTISAKAYEFYLLGKHKFFTRENKDDLYIARELLKKSIEIDDNLISAELALGYTYFDQFKFDEAFEIFSKSLEKSQIIGDNRHIANSLKAVGEIYWGKDIEKSMQCYNKALGIFHEINDKNGIGHTYRDIGNLKAMSGELDNAIIFYGKSLEAFWELGDETYIETERTLNNIGNISIGKGDYTKAKSSLESSLKLNISHENKNGLIRNYWNLFTMYLHSEDYENALKYANLCHNLILSLDIAPAQLSRILYDLGTIHYEMNLYYDALEYYQQSENLLNQAKEDEDLYWINTHQFNLLISSTLCKIKLNKLNINETLLLISNKITSIENSEYDLYNDDGEYNYWKLFELYSLLDDKVNAKRVLEISYNNIIEESKKLNSNDSRKLYLNNNTYNRKVVEEWEKVK